MSPSSINYRPREALEGLIDVSLVLGSISGPYLLFGALSVAIVSVITLRGWQNCSRRADQLGMAGNGIVHG